MSSSKLADSTNGHKHTLEGDVPEPPPSKRSAGAEDESKSTTPHDAFRARLKSFVKEHDFVGCILTRGIESSSNRNDDEEEDEEEEEDPSKYTAAQMATLRYVMINKSRKKFMDEMRLLILGEEDAHGGILMFDTSFSHHVKRAFYDVFKPRYNRLQQKWSQKFDCLFAYTWQLKMYDVWMHDNEGDMGTLVKDLATLWKRLLQKSDAELAVDGEFTRPGVLAFLEDFQKTVEDVDIGDGPGFRFKYC